MRVRLTGQLDESKKAPVDRWAQQNAGGGTVARAQDGFQQEGTLWKRKMRSLALRLPKGRRRRDRSGAPMKRG